MLLYTIIYPMMMKHSINNDDNIVMLGAGWWMVDGVDVVHLTVIMRMQCVHY